MLYNVYSTVFVSDNMSNIWYNKENLPLLLSPFWLHVEYGI